MAADFPLWVIYDHPTDFPDSFVARRWVGEDATDETVTAPTLEDTRRKIWERGHQVCLPRFPYDDPKIVEVWI